MQNALSLRKKEDALQVVGVGCTGFEWAQQFPFGKGHFYWDNLSLWLNFATTTKHRAPHIAGVAVGYFEAYAQGGVPDSKVLGTSGNQLSHICIHTPLGMPDTSYL